MENKLLKEAKDNVAKKYNCHNWDIFTVFHKNDVVYATAMDEVAIEYHSLKLSGYNPSKGSFLKPEDQAHADRIYAILREQFKNVDINS